MNKKVDFPRTAYPISNEVLEALEQFEQQELSWLSGYCAGLAKGRQNEEDNRSTSLSSELPALDNTSSGASSLISDTVATVQILYASQTGNAKAVAENLFDSFKNNYANNPRLEFGIENTNSFKPKSLASKQLLILVASTHGEGEPPDDAIEFLEQLKGKRAPNLNGVQHAVLGLGDSSYEFFCQTGKDIEQQLNKLGSTALVERVDCDLDYETQVEQWISDLNEKALSLIGNELVQKSGASSAQPQSVVAVEKHVSKSNPYTASILANQQITASDSDKRVHHIELSIEDSEISYLPGDGVGIWAKNDSKTVDEILKLSGLRRQQQVEYKGQQFEVYDLLLERLEISLISKDFVKNYYEIAKQKAAANVERLKDILNTSFSDFVKHNQVADVLSVAPIELEAQQLVDLLKPIKPRVYSIASSQQANPDEIHITVKLVANKNDKTVRKGTASRFLIEELQEDQEVMIYIEENHRFRLPEADRDILMVGPGTGIAPFRAFLQEREEQNATGKNWLFFGNSHFNSEFLYQLELQGYLKSGVLKQLSLAFSRDQTEKVYVQDKIRENAASIWQWIDQQKAHFYVCGDMNFMAKDVEQTLLEIIQSQGNFSLEQANDYLKELRKTGRYQRDVY
ncbi:MAG: assimilatory sulfite reductase (NADPH) flavoprotein subunit [Kangiellaceae bacterium]